MMQRSIRSKGPWRLHRLQRLCLPVSVSQTDRSVRTVHSTELSQQPLGERSESYWDAV